MKKGKRFLFKFLMRTLLCFVMIFLINWVLEWRGIPVSVGINAISLVVSGVLGLPGVAMLYGIVATPFL